MSRSNPTRPTPPPPPEAGASAQDHDQAVIDELTRWWDEGDRPMPETIPVLYREAMERLTDLLEALASHPDADRNGMARAVLADVRLVRRWMRQA